MGGLLLIRSTSEDCSLLDTGGRSQLCVRREKQEERQGEVNFQRSSSGSPNKLMHNLAI